MNLIRTIQYILDISKSKLSIKQRFEVLSRHGLNRIA